MPTPLQQAARDYVAGGLHILALVGKRPNGRVHGENWSYEDSFHGTPGEDELSAFELAFSEARGTTGIAILIPPGLYVADVDSDRAAQLLFDLGFVANDGTVVAQTKNGLHIWFWHPEAGQNRWVGDGQEPNPGRTLLFKGLGGYVVAPPSLHFADDGTVDGTYEWVQPLVVGDMLQMPDVLPPGAATRFKMDDQFNATKPDKEQMTSFTMQPADGVLWWQWPKVWEYSTSGLERAIETAAEGNQNNVIHWAAMTCREEGVPYEVSMERLMAAAERGNHPRNRARDTIRGAYKRALHG
jgi:hypothetical protein